MGKYFNYLIQKILRSRTVKVAKKANPIRVAREISLPSSTVMQSAIVAIIGIIGIMIFSTVFSALNTTSLTGESMALFNVVPLILAAGIILSVVMTVISVAS